MKQFTSASPYIACFAILRREDKIAFILRSKTGWMDGKYGLPAGKVEWGESFTHGTIREAKEEVGATIQSQHVHHAITVHRHGPDHDWVDVYFEIDEWEGEPYNAEPNLHSELTWLTVDNVLDTIVPGQRFALEQIAIGHTYAEFGWENE